MFSQTAGMQISGRVEPGYEPVRDAFAANFDRQEELGAACCVYRDGRPVVDIWAGEVAPDGPAWDEDTLGLVFSTTKGAAAVCAHLLASRKELDLDARVVDYWPEFAAAGKGDVPVRWLLTHQVGLPVVDAALSFDEVCAVAPVVAALAAQAPVWKPGTSHGYHALTYGWLVGEVVRRVTGRSLGQVFTDEVAGPLGLDFWIGLPEAEEARVAQLESPPLPTDPELLALMAAVMGSDSLLWRALTLNGALGADFSETGPIFNSRAVHATEMPAANGITTARSLARMYAATVGEVDGVRILPPDTVADACAERASGPDAVLMIESRFGTGFMLDSQLCPMLGPASFGHAGAGGSLGFADPGAGIGFGYVMNRMGADLTGDVRAINLVAAVRACLR